jgi:uncharacterized glyoxalase superfamily metalloenzyme YdcJ
MAQYIDPDDVRTMFSKAMSDMYRSEVPLYGDLVELVHDVNTETLRKDPSLRESLEQRHELCRCSILALVNLPPHTSEPIMLSSKSSAARLNLERHGAIRVGTADEVSPD